LNDGLDKFFALRAHEPDKVRHGIDHIMNAIRPPKVWGIVTNEPTKFRLGQNQWCFNKILTKIIITLTAQALGGTHV
jgi:hypothetical protein